MIEAKDLLGVEDELNLYLVTSKLKPASVLAIGPLSPKSDDIEFTREEFIDEVRYVTFRLNPRLVSELRNILDASGMVYKDWEEESVRPSWDLDGNPRDVQIHKLQTFYFGFNQETLERLVSAKGDEEFGLALGYPEEAVKAYQRVIDGERRNGSYVSVSLAKAKKAGLELPTWLAYISFVPDNLDLINGNVSPSSEALGRRYQDFVRENNPELARRIEQEFLDKKLPDSWEKTPDGSYATRTILRQPNR